MAQPAEASPAASLAKAAVLFAALFALGFLLRPVGLAWSRALPSGPTGIAMLVAGGGVLTAIGMPRQVLAFAAGSLFGAWAGFAWAMLGQLLGAAAGFLLARGVAAGWAQRRLTGRWRQLDRFVLAQPFTAVLTLRLLPVGSNTAVNLLAGAAGVAPAAFFAATALGYLPQTAIFALLGSGVQIGKPAQIAVAVVGFLLSSLLGVVMWRRRGEALRG